MIKWLRTLLLFLVVVYLVLPPAQMPSLPDSLKSDEPGDTVEISGVWAYYTDLPRGEVVNFYRRTFSRSSFLNLPLLTLLLIHPPGYTKEAIRDTVPSTFLYELVHPLRDSLIISGWDPAEDPQYKKIKDPSQVIFKNDRYYQRKVTLRFLESSVFSRLVVFGLGVACLARLLPEAKKILASFFK